MVGQRPIELQELSKYFNMPEKAVAKSLGICLTSLKKICRQHGVTRWPYRKIKSLDKKLRKLEVAMSTAKDDPSMVYAKWGDNAGGSSSSSPPPCSEDASVASTPRQDHDFSPSPPRLSPVQQLPPTEIGSAPSDSAGFSPIPVRVNKDVQQGKSDEPIKIELSLTPAMLKSVASGTGNISFVVQGVEGLATSVSATFASSLLSTAPVHNAIAPSIVVKNEEPEDTVIPKATLDMISLSDDELIAMLAECAGTEPASQGPPSTGSFSLGGRSDMELSDAEIMQALAGCCQAPSSFVMDNSEDALDGSSSSEDTHCFIGIDGDVDFHTFSDMTCGGQYIDL